MTDESLQYAVSIYFCSFGLPIQKSVLGYFNRVVAVAFLVSSPTKFENSASGMYQKWSRGKKARGQGLRTQAESVLQKNLQNFSRRSPKKGLRANFLGDLRKKTAFKNFF